MSSSQMGEIVHTSCPVCNGNIKPLFTKNNNFGTYKIDRCESCGFAFVNPTPSVPDIVEHYRLLGGHGENSASSLQDFLKREADDPNTTVDAERISATLKHYVGGGRLLDVGCGYGFFSLAARKAGFEIDAIEIAPNERKVATELLGFEPQDVLFEDFEASNGYDAIIMSQVLEHSRQPMGWVGKVSSLLNEGGVACVAVPNFGCLFTDFLKDKDPFVIPPAHLNYFTPHSLSEVAGRNNLEVIRLETVTRIPKRSFRRRFGNQVGMFAHRIFSIASGTLDSFQKGVLLNAYVRKVA